MATLNEYAVEDQVTWMATGHIQVRIATVVVRDGIPVARTYKRRVFAPGDDVSEGSPIVQALAANWTQDMIDAVQQAIEDAKATMGLPPES